MTLDKCYRLSDTWMVSFPGTKWKRRKLSRKGSFKYSLNPIRAIECHRTGPQTKAISKSCSKLYKGANNLRDQKSGFKTLEESRYLHEKNSTIEPVLREKKNQVPIPLEGSESFEGKIIVYRIPICGPAR